VARLSITVSSSFRVFGDTSRWQAYNWQAFKWGDGTRDLEVNPTKVVDNSLAPTDNSLTEVLWSRTIENSMAVNADMYSEELKDEAGYKYIYPNNVTDLEQRFEPTFTSGAVATSSWTTAAGSSTTWS
jgi:hypothetical protein